MKKLRKFGIIMIVAIIAVSLLYGCGSKDTENKSAAKDPAAGQESAGKEPEPEVPKAQAYGPYDFNPDHEVYEIVEANRVPWQGMYFTETWSRAHIDKAIKPNNVKDKVKVGYVTWNNSTPFFAISENHLKSLCEQWGYDFVSLCSNGDLNQQIANIENMITMGVDVIIDCDYSVEAELPAIQRAVEAGIPVIGYGLVFPPDSPVITTSACAYYEQGFLVGMYIADYYKDDPDLKVAAIPGMIGHPIGESTLNGFLGGFVYKRAINMGKPFPEREDAMLYGYNLNQEIVKNARFSDPDHGWEIVQSIDGYWSQDGGLAAMETILTSHPDIELVWTANDIEGFGAIQAMENAGYEVGKDIQICSVGDGMRDALQLIKEGKYLCITLASPYTYVGTCARLVYKIFSEGFDATNLTSTTYIADVLVTKDNVDEWMTDDEFTTLPDAEFITIGEY
ncbi:MAG: sugar ABC transporter substrate-binding protein [Bacillota bacterium]|jgi:ribose transport system substrate-binding protein|nr:sugar ABC transporter substrate-binding protein [Bacillota bacterium]HHU30586.1 substrate-binding domain-containing protein [Bacillota bacterium]